MKSFMSKNKKLLAVLIIGLFIFSSGVAFAYTSQDWVVKATAWANTNCSTTLRADAQKALLCYLWEKNNEQQSQLNGIKKGLQKMPVLYDAKGKELGIPISTGAFYNTQIKRNIYYGTGILGFVDTNRMDAINHGDVNIYFDNPDCSGRAYLDQNNGRVFTWVHAIYPQIGEGQSQPDWIRYYIVPNSTNKELLSSAKSFHSGGVCSPLGYTVDNDNVVIGYKAQEIQLPFDTNPMALPLSY